MLSLGHLSPNIVDPTLLRDHLLEVQAKLQRHLKLPADPATEQWHYYNSLGCLTLVENDRLQMVVSLPLLDSSNIYEVFQVINLPIPYSHSSGTVAKYQLESENIALDLTREKSMLLTLTEAEKCKYDLLRTCISNGPIYTFSNHRLCVMELYKDNRRGIEQHCQVEILLDVRNNGWCMGDSLKDELELSQVCAGKSPKTIKITPPLYTQLVPQGCGVYGDSIILPPYHQTEEKFETSDAFLT